MLHAVAGMPGGGTAWSHQSAPSALQCCAEALSCRRDGAAGWGAAEGGGDDIIASSRKPRGEPLRCKGPEDSFRGSSRGRWPPSEEGSGAFDGCGGTVEGWRRDRGGKRVSAVGPGTATWPSAMYYSAGVAHCCSAAVPQRGGA